MREAIRAHHQSSSSELIRAHQSTSLCRGWMRRMRRGQREQEQVRTMSPSATHSSCWAFRPLYSFWPSQVSTLCGEARNKGSSEAPYTGGGRQASPWKTSGMRTRTRTTRRCRDSLQEGKTEGQAQVRDEPIAPRASESSIERKSSGGRDAATGRAYESRRRTSVAVKMASCKEPTRGFRKLPYHITISWPPAATHPPSHPPSVPG